jgi:hypothetical protein
MRHNIPPDTLLDHIKAAFVYYAPSSCDFTLDRVPLMIQMYLEKSQTIIQNVQYWLRQSIVSTKCWHGRVDQFWCQKGIFFAVGVIASVIYYHICWV